MTNKLTIAASLLLLVASGCTKPKGSGAKEEDPRSHLTGGKLVFEDTFDRAELGKDWQQSTGHWKIVDGQVHCEGDENAGLWLDRKLPDRVRLEIDARSESPEGDIKFEIFNEQRSHQTGYICILGGWKNTLSIIARKDEHGDDRLTSTAKLVEKGRTYHFAVVRTGETLNWFVDGDLFMTYPDKSPVRGHYFGLNDWATKLYFDNLRIYEL